MWNFEIGSECHVATFAIYVGSSTPHIVTDVVLLGFPVPLIWNLHMHKSKKIMLTAIFAVGGLWVALFDASPAPTLRLGSALIPASDIASPLSPLFAWYI